MKNHARRIEKMEAELNMGGLDEAAQEERFRRLYPDMAQDMDEFLEKHSRDPRFAHECLKGEYRDKTVNQFADFCLKKTSQKMKEAHRPRVAKIAEMKQPNL
ncbi:MAG: hypothetical protein WBF13_02175 [Candidatus Zixiibacteriota bacterium]